MVTESPTPKMRFDLQVIASWIEPGTKVLDLGCGEGDLLAYLKEHKRVIGTGIDNSEAKVAHCIEKGLSVLHGDLSEEVKDYADQTFDFVILSQTLQQVYEPDKLLKELVRIGRRVVVSFPNFSHWSCRLQLLLQGRAPTTKQLPYSWYNTPNIRVITSKDFHLFACEMGFRIFKEVAISTWNQPGDGTIIKFFPNLRATNGIVLMGT